MIDNLTYEIIKRIVANVGAVPDVAFGTRGLVDEGLALEKTMSVKYDDESLHDHSIYTGKLDLDDTGELRGLLVDLSIDDSYEYLFVFRFNDMPIHAINVSYDNSAESFIRIYNEKNENWILPSIEMMAGLLSSFEKFVSWGLLWNECTNVSDLHDVAIKLVE